MNVYTYAAKIVWNEIPFKSGKIKFNLFWHCSLHVNNYAFINLYSINKPFHSASVLALVVCDAACISHVNVPLLLYIFIKYKYR